MYVNEEGILEPLGVFVLRDSRKDLLPRTKERTEEIPGRHGEINFGSKLQPRILELHLAVSSEITPEEREAKKREIAAYLNPTKVHELSFYDDPRKIYFVKYTGSIDVNQHPNWFDFVVTFKCSDPYVYSVEQTEETLVESNGDGVSIISAGDYETPMLIILENEGSPVNGFTLQHSYEPWVED